jgi:hypothetical protein
MCGLRLFVYGLGSLPFGAHAVRRVPCPSLSNYILVPRTRCGVSDAINSPILEELSTHTVANIHTWVDSEVIVCFAA